MAKQETCLVLCSKCGKKLTAVWNPGSLFGGKKGWTVPSCPSCSEKQKYISFDTVICPHCNARQEKSARLTCLECGKLLINQTDVDTIRCPNCDMEVYIPAVYQGSFKCNHCKHDISEDYILKERPVPAPKAEAQYIKLPDTQKLTSKKMALWKHPVNVFPFKSRIQVSDGTYALLYQNGVCKYPYGPGSYLLEESNLTYQQRIDVAMTKEEDSVVFNTDIYCMLKTLPEVEWGIVTPEIAKTQEADPLQGSSEKTQNADPSLETPEFENIERNAVFLIRSNGRVVYSVCDPRAFMDYIGNREVSFDELVSTGSGQQSVGLLLSMTRKEINDTMYMCMRRMAAAEKIDLDKLKLRMPEVTQALIQEMNSRVLQYGLCVFSLELKAFLPEETQKSKQSRERIEKIQQMAESTVNWKKETTLHAAGEKNLSARFSFSGSCRIIIQDQKSFLKQREIQNYLNGSGKEEQDAENFVDNKCREIIDSQLPQVLQSMIDQGQIGDFLLPDQYPQAAEALRERLNAYLVHDGLSVLYLMLNAPQIDLASYSEELRLVKGMEEKNRMLQRELEDRKRKLELYIVQEQFPLTTQPIRVHMKDDTSIDVTAQFSGKCQLRIMDKDMFFASAEAEGFLRSDPFVTKAQVTDHYRAKLIPPFNSILSVIVQAVVDQTNADVSELNRMMGILQDNVQNNLNTRLEKWGLIAESIDLDTPLYIHSSPNLQAWKTLHTTRTGTELQNEMDRIKNDRVIFIANENGRVEVSVEKVHTSTYESIMEQKNQRDQAKATYDEETAKRQRAERERQHTDRIRGMEMQEELDKLLDEVMDSKKTRSLQSIRAEYLQKYAISEERLQQDIREQQIRQQARIDAASMAQEAEFKLALSRVENKQALNEIIRKIDESDLDWQQKLDEYARLRRQLQEQDAADFARQRAKAHADAEWIDAENKGRIKRENNEIYYEIGSARIKLDAQQADLLDSIYRRAEDLKEKSDAFRQELDERKASLSFDQKMQERAQQLSGDMQRLAQRYQQEQAYWEKEQTLYEKDIELEKLCYVLSYLTKAVQSKERTDIAQFNAEKEVKAAEAKFSAEKQQAQLDAEKQRTAEQVRREDEMAKSAADLQEKMLETQKALDMIRLLNERNADNQRAQVAMYQSDAERAAVEKQSEKADANVQALIQMMTSIIQAVGKAEGQATGMVKPGPVPVVDPVTNPNPSRNSTSFDSVKQLTDLVNSILERITPMVSHQAEPSAQQTTPPIPPVTYGKRCAYCGVWNSAQASQCFHCHAPFMKP